MRNFRIILQYEGTRYQGWQKQESTENTIQGKLEQLLSKMAGTKVEVQGSGRTDAGVHAMGQVANFHIDTDKTAQQIMEYMNFYLPEDIAVVAIKEVAERFHSRLNAKGKTYCYRVINSGIPHVFSRRYAHVVERPLDIPAMQRAAEYLLGTHDFKAFTSTKKSKKSTVRTIDRITIERVDSTYPAGVSGTGTCPAGAALLTGAKNGADAGAEICFTYTGDGFLYHMVRILTGTLLEVGLHERAPEEIETILKTGRREDAGALAPAKGLTLMEVFYS